LEQSFTYDVVADAGDTTAPVISSMSLDKASYRTTQDPNVIITINEDDTASTVTVN
jgi:hypothetical protein